MITQPIEFQDFWQVIHLRDKYYPDMVLPPAGDFLAQTAIWDRDRILGWGLLHKATEATILLDQSQSLRTRSLVLKQLFEKALIASKEIRTSRILAFAPDERYAELLMKHFNFKRQEFIPLERMNGE